jgi:3-oxoadipate enol-lactonase
MIGQNVALRYPQRLASLTLCDTSSRVPQDARATWDERIATAERHGMKPLCEGTMQRWFTSGYLRREPPELRVIRDQFLQTPTSGYVGCCQAIRVLDYTDRLGEISMPVRVIVGAEDPAAPPEVSKIIQEHIAGATLDIIDDASHLSNVEQPAEFNRSLLGFLGVS